MRIISKFRDYYDTIQAYGIDKSIVYKRETSDSTINVGDCKPLIDMLTEHPNVYYGDYHVLGVCGKLYPVFHVTVHDTYMPRLYQYHDEPSPSPTAAILYEQWLYSENEIEKFYSVHYDEDHMNQYKYGFGRHKKRYNNTGYKSPQIEMQAFFKKWSGYKSDIFSKIEIPIFRTKDAKRYNIFDSRYRDKDRVINIISNPCLRDLNFYKIMDPQTMYQELSSYLSGVLGKGQPELVDISDISMRDKKGFDKWSFKKYPTKKR